MTTGRPLRSRRTVKGAEGGRGGSGGKVSPRREDPPDGGSGRERWASPGLGTPGTLAEDDTGGVVGEGEGEPGSVARRQRRGTRAGGPGDRGRDEAPEERREDEAEVGREAEGRRGNDAAEEGAVWYTEKGRGEEEAEEEGGVSARREEGPRAPSLAGLPLGGAEEEER